MKAATTQLYAFSYREAKTYLIAALFIVGNILLPQLCHLLPKGGNMLLPIYLFTLVGAYKYGWKIGLLTALLSPTLNSLIFGMPATAALPSILLKSVLLAVAAGWAAKHYGRVSLLLLLGVVLFYQVFGTMGEWAMNGNLYNALQDFRIGAPGMLLQIFGGWLIIKALK